jgi:hypothetical protein
MEYSTTDELSLTIDKILKKFKRHATEMRSLGKNDPSILNKTCFERCGAGVKTY